jgi:peptide chain release factor 1
LTHIPTGLVAQCQDQKSQHKNKDKAFGVLRSRLYEQELAKKQAEDATKRTSQVLVIVLIKYVLIYAQGRVTDHRVGLTLYDLGNIMNGDIQKLLMN